MFNTLSDPYLAAAFWTGVGAFSVTLALGVQIVVLRALLRRSQRREKKTIDTWRPVLHAAIAGVATGRLPVLSERSCIVFFKLWVHLHASLRGSADTALNDLGYRLGCDTLACRLLHHGNRAERLLATLVLGYLHERQAWTGLMNQAQQADSTTSLYAVWALVQIDATSAMPHLMPSLIARSDWPLSLVVTMLQEARELCAPLLVDALPLLDAAQLPRALRIVEGLRITLPHALHESMLHSPSIEVIAAALRIASEPALLHQVRALAGHADWRVRVRASKTLGRIGEQADLDILKHLLDDAQWWVRYRAAEALVSSPFFVRQDVELLVRDTDDPFAVDMLRQVLAEEAPA